MTYSNNLQEKNINAIDILQRFSPKTHKDYYLFSCPECGKGKAYVYKKSLAEHGIKAHIKCNRKNNCTLDKSIWEYCNIDIQNRPQNASPAKQKPLPKSTLTIEQLAKHKGFTSQFLENYCTQLKDGIQINYWDEHQELLPIQRIRLQESANPKDGSKSCLWQGQGDIAPYGIWQIEKWALFGYVVLTEGESDAWTLWKHNIPAFGIPGASLQKCLKSHHVNRFRKIYIEQEADEAGAVFAKETQKKLTELKFKGEIQIIDMSITGVVDISDLYLRNPEEFIKEWNELKKGDEPDAIPDKKDIPLEVDKIHPVFGGYLQNITGKTDAPPEFVLASLLTSLGSAIGNKTYLCLGNQKIAPNLYTLLIGASTLVRKGTSLGYGTAALKELDGERKERYFQEMEDFKVEMEERTGRSKNERGERPAEPKDMSIIYPNDVTPEMLLKKMTSRPDGLFIASEMGGLLAKMNTSYSGGLKEMLTELYDFTPKYTKETKSSGSYLIKNACLSLLAASTVQWLQKWLTEEDLLSGFLGRFCFVVRRSYPAPVAIPKKWSVDVSYIKLFREIEKLQLGEVKMSADAEKAYEDWFYKFHESVVSDNVFLHSFLGRLETTVHKVAIINHVLNCVIYKDNINSTEINAECYQQAIAWIEFFAENIRGCFDELSQSDLKEKKVIEIIQKKSKDGLVAASVVAKYSNMRKKELQEIIETLTSKNWVKELKKGKYTYYKIAKRE